MKITILILSALMFSPGAFAINPAKPQVVSISVTENGFEPSSVEVKTDAPVVLKITRK